jgi:hypothetical protein
MFPEQGASTYLAARIAAFLAAHGTVRLCAECVRGKVSLRNVDARRVGEPIWCEACGTHATEGFRLPVREFLLLPRRRTAQPGKKETVPASSSGAGRTVDCPICSGAIRVTDATNLVFRPDGRVEHRRCPDPVCPRCQEAVTPQQPKLRSGRDLFHRDCLFVFRSKGSISGGSAPSPCTAIFDERRDPRAHQS